MPFHLVKVYATYEKPDDLYLSIYENEDDALAASNFVIEGWLILDEKEQPAIDSHDIYFHYSEAIEDLLTLENKWSHG